jgi:hypothetical protein
MFCGIENSAFYCQTWFGILFSVILLSTAVAVVTYSFHEKIRKLIGKSEEENINVLFNEEHPGTTYQAPEEELPSEFLAWIAENDLTDSTNESILYQYFRLNEKTQISILKYELDSDYVTISVILPNDQAVVFSVSKSIIHFNVCSPMAMPHMAVNFEPDFLKRNFEYNNSWSAKENVENINWDDVFNMNNVASLTIYIDNVDYKKVTKPIV